MDAISVVRAGCGEAMDGLEKLGVYEDGVLLLGSIFMQSRVGLVPTIA